MPLFLGKYLSSSLLIGAIMGLDNVLGFTLQPWIGSRSDRTHSSWGRRRPFLLIGMPIAALSLISLHWTYDAGLVLLLLTTGVPNLAISPFRSPPRRPHAGPDPAPFALEGEWHHQPDGRPWRGHRTSA